MLWRLIIGGIIYAAALTGYHAFKMPLSTELAMLIAAYLILGYDVILTAVRSIRYGHVFSEHFLMSIATIGAFVIGEYPEAVAVMLFYQIGEFCQDLAVDNSRRSIAGLMEIRPDSANLMRNGKAQRVPAQMVQIDDEILIHPGERVPLDGVIVSGTSSLDTKALTGESMPRDVKEGDEIFSGCINLSGLLTARVVRVFEESAASKIIDMVENASARKAPMENFITKFAAVYTPIVVFMALGLALIPPLCFGGDWPEWIHRALVFLVISCPCAFVISIPLTFFGGIGAAAKSGILVKGGNYLEALNAVHTVVFDKTGTLTQGIFAVTSLQPAEGVSEEELLYAAACAECYSDHPIARSVTEAYGQEIDKSRITDAKESAGFGVQVQVDGHLILAGNRRLMEREKLSVPEQTGVGTTIHVARDGAYLGYILIGDVPKSDSKEAIIRLKEAGVKQTVMLTGDSKTIAADVAGQLGLDAWHAELLPQDKVRILEELDANKPKGSKLVFVGDGINDAPVLARADIGISMGGLGADAAIEAADVVLMTDEPSRIADAIRIAGKTRRIVLENIIFALAVKVVFLILGALGIAGMWAAVFGDVGVTLLAVANALRMMQSGQGRKSANDGKTE